MKLRKKKQTKTGNIGTNIKFRIQLFCEINCFAKKHVEIKTWKLIKLIIKENKEFDNAKF